MLNVKPYTFEIHKSILSDIVLIPFKDKTKRKETYGGGRYIDAEILPEHKNDSGLQHGLPSFLCLQP